MLSTAAFNALLKTLEEPPSHVVFVLATTDPQKVPETIHSRCQRFDFRRISQEALVSRLGAVCVSEGVEFEGEALDLVAHRAEGGMRNALTSLEQLIAFGEGKVTLEVAERMLGGVDTNDLAEIVRAIGTRDVAGCFRWTAEFVETGADLAQFARDLAEHVRNLYVMALTDADVALEVGDTERRELASELPLFGPDRLSRLLGVLGDLSAELKTSTNPRLSFEIALTRMVRAGFRPHAGGAGRARGGVGERLLGGGARDERGSGERCNGGGRACPCGGGDGACGGAVGAVGARCGRARPAARCGRVHPAVRRGCRAVRCRCVRSCSAAGFARSNPGRSSGIRSRPASARSDSARSRGLGRGFRPGLSRSRLVAVSRRSSSWRRRGFPGVGREPAESRSAPAHLAGRAVGPQEGEGRLRGALPQCEGRLRRRQARAFDRVPGRERVRVQSRAKARRAAGRVRRPRASVRRGDSVRLRAGRRRLRCAGADGAGPRADRSAGVGPLVRCARTPFGSRAGPRRPCDDPARAARFRPRAGPRGSSRSPRRFARGSALLRRSGSLRRCGRARSGRIGLRRPGPVRACSVACGCARSGPDIGVRVCFGSGNRFGPVGAFCRLGIGVRSGCLVRPCLGVRPGSHARSDGVCGSARASSRTRAGPCDSACGRPPGACGSGRGPFACRSGRLRRPAGHPGRRIRRWRSCRRSERMTFARKPLRKPPSHARGAGDDDR